MKAISLLGSICLLSVSLFAAEGSSACAPAGASPERVEAIKNGANTILQLTREAGRQALGRELTDEEVIMFVGITSKTWENSKDEHGCLSEFSQAECQILADQIRACVAETIKANAK